MPSDVDDYDDDYSGGGDEVEIRRLVLSIDFGTTYTGIGFATPLGDNAALYEIDIVMEWGNGMENSDKIPSVISYSSKSRERPEANWGSNLAEKAIAMKHMKLRLDSQSVSEELDFLLQLLDGTRNLDFENIKDARGMPDYTDKPPEEIVTDYLTKVFEHVLHKVDNFTREVRETIPTDIVITVPVGWSYAARNSTYRAVTKAGFNKRNFPRLQDVMFISEPEAAAIYTARYFDEQNEQFLNEEECFILVDAGGGTVDIVSYQVKRLQPLELERIGKPTGSRCGSIFIDQAFKDWLRRLLTDRYYLQLDPDADVNNIYGVESSSIRSIMANFDILKKDFSQDSEDVFLDLPVPLHNLSLDDRVDCGQITITREAMEDFFNPCVDEIVEMVKYHIRSIDDHGARCKNLFLIGGFGESKFLQQELEDTLKRRDDRELRVPDTSWTAVARGAVICGIEKDSMANVVRTSASPKHYGIAIDESAHGHTDERDLDVNAVTGKAIARNQMRWLINKGDVILSNEATVKEHKFVVRFREGEESKKRGSVPLYSYSEDKHRPTRLSNAKKELHLEETVEYDLSLLPLSEFKKSRTPDSPNPYYTANVTLKLSLTDNGLKTTLLFKGEPLGFSSAGAGPNYHIPGRVNEHIRHHANTPSMASLTSGMYNMGITGSSSGLGPGPGRGNSFGRRNERGRLSVRENHDGFGVVDENRSSGASYVRVRPEEFGGY